MKRKMEREVKEVGDIEEDVDKTRDCRWHILLYSCLSCIFSIIEVFITHIILKAKKLIYIKNPKPVCFSPLWIL